MDSAHKTLIDIATVSQRLVNTLDRCVGYKTAESFQLDKIIVGSRTVLETFNRMSLLKDRNIDDRLLDWLKSEEPQVCLRTLNQMGAILDKKLEYGVKSFFKASQAAHTQQKTREATGLFHMRKSYFHFLLTAEVWNHEDISQQQPPPAITSNALQIDRPLQDKRVFTPIAPHDGSDSSDANKTRVMEGNRNVDLRRLDDVLGWLNAYSPRDTHERTILLRQPDTCVWLFNTPQYKTWRGTAGSFLWLNGISGAGKSVLAASVIESLKATLQDGELLMFFYCDFRNERSTSAVEVMRSILSQLLRKLRRNTVDLEDLIDELVEEMDEGSLSINSVMLLARHISSVAKQFSGGPFLVIDALDECRDTDLLLEALVELQKAGVRMFLTSRPLQVVKEAFFGLSSISMDAVQHLVSVDIKLHSRRELDSHRRLRLLDSSLKNEIYFALCERAGGMFRWVQCQLDSLKRCVTADRIREALKNLPKDLNGTYERILLQIDEDEEGKVVRRTLDWLLFAFVPLQLCQIMEILSIDLRQRALSRDSGPVHGPALLDALGSLVMYDERTDIVSLSHFSVKEYLTGRSSLAKHPAYRFNQRDAHTRLALLCIGYIAVYLEKNEQPADHKVTTHGPWSYHHDSNAVATYPKRRPGLSDPSHPFLEYVLPYGFRHLASVKWRIPTVLHAITSLRSVIKRHTSEWERLCDRSYNIPWPTAEHDFVMYILVAFASYPLLRLFVGRAKPHIKDGTNPLIYAAHFRKTKHAMFLLSRGVSLNRTGWDVTSSTQCLPLEVALRHGDSAIVDLFLAEGSPVPQGLFMRVLERKDCDFPLHNVARLFQVDEFVEWAVVCQDEELPLRALDPTRFHSGGYPSQQDMDYIRRRLIQVGYDPSVRFDETSLRNAARLGHVSTVKQILSLKTALPASIILDASINSNPSMIRFLLSMGCRVDVTSPTGDTPLHLVIGSWKTEASEHDRLKSVQALTDAGCSSSACNEIGDTPLHLAVRRGYTSVVEHLLSFPLPLPTNILLATPKSALNTAPIIRLLVDYGANVHAMEADGNTPLHKVLKTRSDDGMHCLECAEILVNAGCQVCSPNFRGETPMDIAARNGHFHVVEYFLSMNLLWSSSVLLSVSADSPSNGTSMTKFLVDKGADIRATLLNGDTPLHLAIEHLWEPICLDRIQVLVDAGCDARACNSAGKTPFHVAASRGLVSVMEYLLSLGLSVPLDSILTQFEGFGASCQSIYFLLERGGDMHTVAENGDTLLHLAATFDSEQDALELTKFLVRAGCSPCASNSLDETPFHVAAQNGCISIMEYLLSLDVALPRDILLAASRSSESSKRETVLYLIEKGANASVANTDGDTALHLLLEQGDEEDCLENLKNLSAAGCDAIRSRNLAGETPLHIAARRGFTTILEHLLSQNVPLPRDILLASAPSTIRFLLEKGAGSPDTVTKSDMGLVCRTLGALGSDDSCQAFAELLVRLGLDPSLHLVGKMAPINVAARRGHIHTVKYLCSENVSLPSDVLLEVAAATSDVGCRCSSLLPVVCFLIRKGAHINDMNSNGDTPLHLALRCEPFLHQWDDSIYDHFGSWRLVEILLDGGSDPSARNSVGQTPFDIAEANGRFFNENFLRLVRKSRLLRS